MDVLARQPALRLYLDLPLEQAKREQYVYARVIVENVREASCYLDPADAAARDATVTLAVPQGYRLDPQHSVPATISLGDLAPGERRLADWWVTVERGAGEKLPDPFVLTAKAEGSPPTVVRAREDVSVPFAQPQEVGVSGAEWLEAPYRMPTARVQPGIAIETLAGSLHGPAVSDGTASIRYNGTLEERTRLALEPPGRARLFALPLVDDRGESRADAADPTGFRAFDEGYHIVNQPVGLAVEPGRPLRVTIAGKAEGGAQSLVILRFATGQDPQDLGLLVNAFGPEWREASEEVTVPDGALSLQNVFLYRFGQVGRIWYGPLRIERADVDPGGQDVSVRLEGTFPTLSRDAFSVLRYTDDDPPTASARVRVQLRVPEEKP
jgi:hypothetical protein